MCVHVARFAWQDCSYHSDPIFGVVLSFSPTPPCIQRINHASKQSNHMNVELNLLGMSVRSSFPGRDQLFVSPSRVWLMWNKVAPPFLGAQALLRPKGSFHHKKAQRRSAWLSPTLSTCLLLTSELPRSQNTPQRASIQSCVVVALSSHFCLALTHQGLQS